MNRIKNKILPDINKGFYTEIFSGGDVMLTGNFDIEDLEDTVLKLKNNEHRICFYGKGIRIISYTTDGIRLEGNIEKIEF